MALGSAVLPARIGENQLLGPLQSLRFLSKSVAFAILGVVVFLALPGVSKGDRPRSAGLASTSFFCFQLLYAGEFALFAGEGLLRGSFGIVAIMLMYLAFAVGFGRLMQDRASASRSLEVFAWVAVAFVGMNLIQIVFGLSGALVGGRLAGTLGVGPEVE